MSHLSLFISRPGRRKTNEMGNGAHQAVGLRELVALMIGLVFGLNIFKAPFIVANMIDNSWTLFWIWAGAGIVSLIGALCYTELATTYPHTGGIYHLLHRAYGRSISFLFAWTRLTVFTTGSIVFLAFVFGDAMNKILSLDAYGISCTPVLYAGTAVVLFSWLNGHHVRLGTFIQISLTSIAIAGVLAIIIGALLIHQDIHILYYSTPLSHSHGSASLIGIALLASLTGWGEATYLSSEIRDGRRNMRKAFVISILIITFIYMFATWVYWKILGFNKLAAQHVAVADALLFLPNPFGEKIIAAVSAICALMSLNATMIIGARNYHAVGLDWPQLGKLAFWSEQRGTPINAFRFQCFAALAFIVIGALLGNIFNTIIELAAPVFWLYFLLCGISLFILRMREPVAIRPFSVPLFPLLPLLFCATCVYMLWTSFSYVIQHSFASWNAVWIGVSVIGSGMLALRVLNRMPAAKKHEFALVRLLNTPTQTIVNYERYERRHKLR